MHMPVIWEKAVTDGGGLFWSKLTTRVPSGSVEEEYSYEGSALSMKDSGIILGGRLSSWKARLLLALAMGKTKNIEEIRSCFLEIREE